MSEHTLTVPLNTRVLSVERLQARGCVSWALWTETNSDQLAKPHTQRQGTYLLLTPEGVVYRVTVNGDQEDVLLVME